MSQRFLSVLLITSLGAPLAALADTPVWTGEGSLSASTSSGNTETTDIGAGLKLNRDTGKWDVDFAAAADFGETDGIETENRIFLSLGVDRQINDRLFGFGSASWEQDEFSGFDSRTFVGGGLGYEVIVSDRTNWTVRGGPGFKIDEVKPTLDTTVDPVVILEPARTEESISAIGESKFSHDINDAVTFSNDSRVLYAETSTQLSNTLSLTADLTNTLAARFSFEARFDTDPPQGFEDTDTVTRFSIVYKFGA